MTEVQPVPVPFKNIIISGGARGIGRALTRMMLEAGHHAYIFDIDGDEMEHTVKVHLKAYHDDGRLGYALCDLRNVEDIRVKVKQAAKFFNDRIDVLINNGGIASPYWKDGKTMEDPDTFSEWQAYMDTNLTGPFAMSQACIPYMKARASDVELGAHMQNENNSSPAGPCIIHIGSFRAHQSDPNQEGYASSKAGQLGLMHSMAISLGSLGIRVNLIAPGRIKVAHESKEGDEKGLDWAGQNERKDVEDHATNRAGRPKDIADAALYLMEAGFVTGQDFTIDGGALRMKKNRPPDRTNRHPLLEPLQPLRQRGSAVEQLPPPRSTRGFEPSLMYTLELVTTPTADTPGTAIILRTSTKAYVFGSLAEGTQRALIQQGTRLLKAQDFFLTGKAEWKNTGGLVGMMLTLADSTASSYNTTMEAYRKGEGKGRSRAQAPPKPQFNLYGPPNLKHLLGTCRRFIFRKGMPIITTEYPANSPQPDEHGNILPTWQDTNLDVWALSIAPANRQRDTQSEAALEAQRQRFDRSLNTFADHQPTANETTEEREQRYDRIRSATMNFMFDSNWSFDTLIEQHISEVEMPTAMFIRNPHTKGYLPYTGPKPGGPDPLPDVKVWTRTPWPGAKVLALPPTEPAADCISYIVRTKPVRGPLDVVRARLLGVKAGPDYGKLTRGESVQSTHGDWITPDQVIGSSRPGQGVAILDVPSIDYLETLIQREEFKSTSVMSGIKAFIWMLGPGVVGHALLDEFMRKWHSVEHIISSMDTNPNRIANDSGAGQATRLGLVDPGRYSTPVFDNETVPQCSLYRLRAPKASPLPKNAIAAERGMSFALMPKFVVKTETASTLFDPQAASDEILPEVLNLAAEARQAVQDSTSALQAWRRLLARPDTEIITLGTGSASPSKYRNVSATLMRVPGVGNYLFDAGESTLGQLSRVFPWEELIEVLRNLRVIWISHLHADHHLGTVSVIRAWYQVVHGGVPNRKPLDVSDANAHGSASSLSVISHSGMLQFLREYSAVEDFGYSRILPLQIFANDRGSRSTLTLQTTSDRSDSDSSSPQVAVKWQDYERLFGFSDIQAVKVAHCHGAMACSLTFPPSPSDPEGVTPLKVSYSGDCRPSQAFARIGAESTVLIHEATFDDELQGDAKAKKHSTTSEAIGIGSQMEAKAVVLTHFSQRYQKMPVLQTIVDGEQEDPVLNAAKFAEDPVEDEETIDPTTENADNMDIHPTSTTLSCEAKIISTPSTNQPSSLTENQRVIKIRNKDMKVAIAFDYMRVKIGEIAELEKFNMALNELLVKEDDEEKVDPDVLINENGKKMSGDEGGIGKKKQKKSKSQRNN
ncbi:hypothetical protein T440DRAFT_408493 [Plenodomus tracheiphilus IPT5]|uniref:ribonuclease Z n=1 Tax=Plenodomus tracheiphilus IPT5 TaxID=1408161 RepID=A0A6A7APS3_9PLEO|nr:hypothetical protein T440DRAFT_408493 [Plenodomus tracheiphilus IPT5]